MNRLCRLFLSCHYSSVLTLLHRCRLCSMISCLVGRTSTCFARRWVWNILISCLLVSGVLARVDWGAHVASYLCSYVSLPMRLVVSHITLSLRHLSMSRTYLNHTSSASIQRRFNTRPYGPYPGTYLYRANAKARAFNRSKRSDKEGR
jgi:hypothetical protein